MGERRQLLPPYHYRDDRVVLNEDVQRMHLTSEQPAAREVAPFSFQLSRLNSLPYATAAATQSSTTEMAPQQLATPTRKTGSNKRGLDSATPKDRDFKKRELTSDAPPGKVQSRMASHADFTTTARGGYMMSQSTSDDMFNTQQTSDSVYEFASSPPHPYDLTFGSSPPDSSQQHQQQQESEVGDETLTAIRPHPQPAAKLSSLRKSFTDPSAKQADENKRAVDMIRRAIDEGSSTVVLTESNLTQVPSQIEDLNYMVSSSTFEGTFEAKIRIFLDSNRLISLPPQLFNVRALTVLILRNNELEHISPAIGQLVNLQELSLARNKLKYLPSEILNLPKLAIFSVHPNPFLQASAIQKKRPVTPSSSTNSQSIYHTQLHMDTDKNVSKFQSILPLIERCQLIIADLTTRQEIKWTNNLRHLNLIEHGKRAYQDRYACGVCGRHLVNGVAHAYEWRDGVFGQPDIVVRRNICTLRCVDRWKTEMSLLS